MSSPVAGPAPIVPRLRRSAVLPSTAAPETRGGSNQSLGGWTQRARHALPKCMNWARLRDRRSAIDQSQVYAVRPPRRSARPRGSRAQPPVRRPAPQALRRHITFCTGARTGGHRTAAIVQAGIAHPARDTLLKHRVHCVRLGPRSSHQHGDAPKPHGVGARRVGEAHSTRGQRTTPLRLGARGHRPVEELRGSPESVPARSLIAPLSAGAGIVPPDVRANDAPPAIELTGHSMGGNSKTCRSTFGQHAGVRGWPCHRPGFRAECVRVAPRGAAPSPRPAEARRPVRHLSARPPKNLMSWMARRVRAQRRDPESSPPEPARLSASPRARATTSARGRGSRAGRPVHQQTSCTSEPVHHFTTIPPQNGKSSSSSGGPLTPGGRRAGHRQRVRGGGSAAARCR